MFHIFRGIFFRRVDIDLFVKTTYWHESETE